MAGDARRHRLDWSATIRNTQRVRIVVYVLIALILASLASALMFVLRDRSGSKRAVKALALRVALSIALFILLLAGFHFGYIPGKL
jgi:hypothetical protein